MSLGGADGACSAKGHGSTVQHSCVRFRDVPGEEIVLPQCVGISPATLGSGADSTRVKTCVVYTRRVSIPLILSGCGRCGLNPDL
jgi:hypothetical protein